MGKYLNSRVPFEVYGEIAGTRFFVDKSLLLDDILNAVEIDGQKYLCITRPRQFGKTVMANMVAAFLGKAADAGELFEQLAIGRKENYKAHLNKHNVVYIDFSEVPRDCTNYRQYIARIQDGINNDLVRAYEELPIDTTRATWDILTDIFQKKGGKFVFVMDECDAMFHMSFITQEDKEDYLLFLKSLLKGKTYVELAYMTGVLPIPKYSSGSELNMFVEYDMTVMERFSGCFGFVEDEVDRLFDIYLKTTKRPKIRREELRVWYDGSHTAAGERLYNPRSVVCALANNQLASYWASSGPYDFCHQAELDDLRTHQRAASDEIFFYVKNNIDDIRDDLVLMIAGEGVEAEIQNYAAVSMELNTKDEIYSAMVTYGLLTYMEGEVFIPNKELMDKFKELLIVI